MQRVKRIGIAIYLVALHLVVLFFIGERLLRNFTTIAPIAGDSVQQPGGTNVVPTPLPLPDAFEDIVNANANANANIDANASTSPPAVSPSSVGLIIPVVGVRADQLIDTYSQARSEDRSHDAIDIPAPAGTPVVAAADGEILRFFDSERGGITIYQLTSDRKFVLYYAHLQRRADEITVGKRVLKGTTIGFVGDTGNAGAGNTHLHFSIAIVTDPKRMWSGTYVNPYPLLKYGQYPQ